MGFALNRINKLLISWLMRDRPSRRQPLCDFDKLRYEIRPCDVLLFEGRSRTSEVIKLITQSPWSHAALYIGRLHDIENETLRRYIKKHFDGPEDAQLLIESVLGKGTIITDLSFYLNDHIRICRPQGISRQDAQKVLGYSISHIGVEYDIWQIFDLARLLYPWWVCPRRWRSSLFQRKVGKSAKIICSSLLAEAFHSVRFPILPAVKINDNKTIELVPRNPRLFTPSDFDYSPYFQIIKYPFYGLEHRGPLYRDLPWNQSGVLSNDGDEFVGPDKE